MPSSNKSNIRQAIQGLITAVAVSVAAGCSTDTDAPSQKEIMQRAKTLMPADAELAEIYRRSCMSCHAVAETTAPLTGDTQQWQARMTQDMDTLVDHVIHGYGGMPPFGLCMDCEPEQFKALILFMAQ